MPAALVSWTTDALAVVPSPTNLHVGSDRLGGSLSVANNATYSLGSDSVNPLCQEHYGQNTGDLCTYPVPPQL